MRPWAAPVVALLVFAGSLAWLASGTEVGQGGEDTPPFHIDEAHKLGEAFYFNLFFQQRDWGHPAWAEDFYARTNPPVAKYFFGAALAATGHPVRDRQAQVDFENHWQEPDRLRGLIPDGMLRVTRGVSIAFGAGLATLLFIIARRVAGTPAGFIAVVLLLGNPSFAQTARRGLTDTILLFHLVLIVPVTLWAVDVLRRYWQGELAGGRSRQGGILVLATVLLPATAIALATGSKLNGWLTGPAYAGAVLVAPLVCRGTRPLGRRLALALAAAVLAGITAVVLFVAINPWFHHETIGRMIETLRIWGDWMIVQQISPGPGLFTLHQRITAVGYYSLHGVALPLSRYFDVVGAAWLGTWLTVLGFSVGMIYLVGRAAPDRRAARPAPDERAARARLDAAVVLCWIAVCTLGVTLWLPVGWDRHMLPPYLTMSLTTAIGLGVLPGLVRSFVVWLRADSPKRVEMWTIAGTGAAGALWGILTFTPWVISPMLLPDAIAWSDPDAINARTESHLVHGNIASVCLHLGMYRDAAGQYERALALLDASSERGGSSATQQAGLLWGLAEARKAAGDRPGAAEAFGQFMTIMRQLRDAMRTRDSYVRGCYDLNIATAAGLLRECESAKP